VISPERLTTADRQIPVALATIEPCFDSTSKGYGEGESRRGTLVVPGEMEWIIEPVRADPTSGSLRDTLHCMDWRIGYPRPVIVVLSRPTARL